MVAFYRTPAKVKVAGSSPAGRAKHFLKNSFSTLLCGIVIKFNLASIDLWRIIVGALKLGDMLFSATASLARFTEILNSTWNQTVCFTTISVCLSEISELLFESVL